MPNTANLAIPYPASSQAPDIVGDLYAALKRIDDLFTTGPVTPAGTNTLTSDSLSIGKRSGNSVVLSLSVIATAASSASTNSLLASVGGGVAPASAVRFPMFLYAGGQIICEWRPNGGVYIVSGTVSGGTTLIGSIETGA